jgi:hypothetical protein
MGETACKQARLAVAISAWAARSFEIHITDAFDQHFFNGLLEASSKTCMSNLRSGQKLWADQACHTRFRDHPNKPERTMQSSCHGPRGEEPFGTGGRPEHNPTAGIQWFIHEVHHESAALDETVCDCSETLMSP